MNNLSIEVKRELGVIDFNFDELKAAAIDYVKEYENASFTEESKAVAKSTVAHLRSLKKEIDDRRKTVKKEYMKPYEDFEEKVKEILTLFDKPIGLIDTQVKNFDEARRVEKIAKIEKIYEENVDDQMKEYLPLSKIYDKKWENATTTIKSITEAIQSAVTEAKTAIETINMTNSDAVEDALSIYKQSLSLSEAIAHINHYEKTRADIILKEERKLAEERERRIREEERAKIEAEMLKKQAENVQPIQPAVDSDETPFEAEEELPFVQTDTHEVIYRVVATDEELEAVEMAFNSIGIYFKRETA